MSAKCQKQRWRTVVRHNERDRQPYLQAAPKDTYSACMTDILDAAYVSQDEPKLIVRKAPHARVWSVWAVLEGIPSEEIFEGSSEEEASSWINTGGQAWLEERRRKRNA
jgi:hypothetical protein